MIQIVLLTTAAVGVLLGLLIACPGKNVFQMFNRSDWPIRPWHEWIYEEGLTLNQGIILLILLLLFVVSVILILIYEVVLERVFSRTIGKKVMGLMVVDKSGIQITWAQAVIRNLSKIFELLLSDVVLGMILENQDLKRTQKQRGMDILADTIVVKL